MFFKRRRTLELEIDHWRQQSKGWEQSAGYFAKSSDYYQGLLDEIAKNFGQAAYTSDDGSIQDSPIRAKMPELVKQLNITCSSLENHEPQILQGNKSKRSY